MATTIDNVAPTTPGGHDQHRAHEGEEELPDVLVEADKALAEFKRRMQAEYYPKASSLQERAKILFEDVKKHWTEGKRKVLHKQHGSGRLYEWTSDDFDLDMNRLLHEQESSWDELERQVAEERTKMDATYKKVLQAKEAVEHARGSVNHIPLVDLFFDLSTPEQHTICNVYNKKMRCAFQDAAKEYHALEAYPDGLLTQVHVLRKRANEETAHLVEWLAKKEHHRRHGGPPPPPAPHDEDQEKEEDAAKMPEAVTPTE